MILTFVFFSSLAFSKLQRESKKMHQVSSLFSKWSLCFSHFYGEANIPVSLELGLTRKHALATECGKKWLCTVLSQCFKRHLSLAPTSSSFWPLPGEDASDNYTPLAWAYTQTITRSRDTSAYLKTWEKEIIAIFWGWVLHSKTE